MTKRYSDTLRERAELAHNEWTTFSDGYSAALVHVADELDSPEFSGRIVYDQRNAAREEAKRWEAEAKQWSAKYHRLLGWTDNFVELVRYIKPLTSLTAVLSSIPELPPRPGTEPDETCAEEPT